MNAARLLLGWRVAALAILLAGASGCMHKTKVTVVPIPPPQQLPVDTTAKVEQPQPWVLKVPLQPSPLPAVVVPTKKVKMRRKPVAPAAAPPSVPVAPAVAAAAPVQVASAGPVAEMNAIGALTAGGSEGPQLRREAAEMIAALEKRLEALPAELKEKEKDQLTRVRNFQREAQIALNAGDSDGAVTLATKAKLLLDDVVK